MQATWRQNKHIGSLSLLNLIWGIFPCLSPLVWSGGFVDSPPLSLSLFERSLPRLPLWWQPFLWKRRERRQYWIWQSVVEQQGTSARALSWWKTVAGMGPCSLKQSRWPSKDRAQNLQSHSCRSNSSEVTTEKKVKWKTDRSLQHFSECMMSTKDCFGFLKFLTFFYLSNENSSENSRRNSRIPLKKTPICYGMWKRTYGPACCLVAWHK